MFHITELVMLLINIEKVTGLQSDPGWCPVSSVIPGVGPCILPPLSQYHHHHNVTPALIEKISSNGEDGFSMGPITWV